jgi:imidazole glycerol-phosphate synthase subunit HisH
VDGLGWINAKTVRFHVNDPMVKVPHMGWNTVTAIGACPLLRGFDEEQRFYFVHSYHLVCDDPALTVGMTSHGYEFASVIQQGNIFGVQFHPEKSNTFGLRLLKNFLEIDPSC